MTVSNQAALVVFAEAQSYYEFYCILFTLVSDAQLSDDGINVKKWK